jgi:nickel-type superoxide dismutase maturation protease
MRRWRGPIGLLLVCLALIAVARRRLDVVEVRGRSMAPSLQPGDRLVVVRSRRPPRTGDVVLALDPRAAGRELVKRVARVDRSGGVTLRGDNLAFSTDARAFGTLPLSAIRWRVALRYWPVRRAGRIPPAPVLVEEGGEPACAFPEALVIGE